MFSQITMAVPDHASIAKFYRQTLGMTDQRDGLGYGAQQAHMNFLQQSTPADKADGFYWKIGITVANLDAAADYLRQSGVSISAPRQFADIGYMAHCTDPAGATIELLQQYPMGGERDIGDSHPVASGRDPCPSNSKGARSCVGSALVRRPGPSTTLGGGA